MRSSSSWRPLILLGIMAFLIIGLPMIDDALGELTEHKGHCLVTGIEADVEDVGKLTAPRPVHAHCKIAELGLSWKATAAQLGVTDWTAAIGDGIDADVTRSVSRFMRREHFGSYIFNNVKRA